MRYLPNPEHPLFVSDRLSAVSNVPMQFLVSVGILSVILIAAALTDLLPNSDRAAGLADAQRIAAMNTTALRLTIGDRDWHATDPCLQTMALQTCVAE
jgi:hypothetical protein